MPSQKNIDQLNQLVDKIKQAKSIVLSDYQGMSVASMQKLKKAVKKTGGELTVAKNTLLGLALGKIAADYDIKGDQALKGADSLIGQSLLGPTAILFNNSDEIDGIKALVDFVEENELPKLKIGFFQNEVIEADKITLLGKIPSKEVLYSQLVGMISSPMRQLANVLSANQRKLVYILGQIKE